jgi:ribosomal protein S27AE
VSVGWYEEACLEEGPDLFELLLQRDGGDGWRLGRGAVRCARCGGVLRAWSGGRRICPECGRVEPGVPGGPA